MPPPLIFSSSTSSFRVCGTDDVQPVPARAPGESLENGPRRLVAPRLFGDQDITHLVQQAKCDAFVDSLSLETQQKVTSSVRWTRVIGTMRVVPLSAAMLLLLPLTCLASIVTKKSSNLRKGMDASNGVDTEEQNMAEDSSYWKRLMQETANMSADIVRPSDKGEVGDLCFENADCNTGVCVEDPPAADGSGRCACNADTQEGCDDGFFCATPGEIGLAVGELISVATFCKLPVGVPCQDSFDCLTQICDSLTSTCGCNPFTNFPCSDGEACLIDPVNGHVCKVPEGEVGDGSLGSDCLVDEDCVTDECYYGFQPPGTLGTCTCNPLTNAGCSGDFECFSSGDLQDISSIFDAPNECSLPFGAPCDERTDIGNSCVTGNCAKATNQCTCNELTNYPCDTENGETCAVDGEGSLACLTVEPFVVKPDCPDPNSDIACTAEFKEVVCPGDCKYSNQCVATSADPTFTNETCSLVEPDLLVAPECPEPSDTPCTLEEAPVICQGDCEYANQCVATSADPTFTNETCKLVNTCPVVGTGICTLEYIPVNCFGCEYANQCFATTADESFTSETCSLIEPDSLVCPDPNSDIACTAEFKEVVCPGDCNYSNQCVATSADSTFTNETCSLVELDPLVEPECPVPSGATPCTLEEVPVICTGDCEYANQCVATSADPTFTNETCSLVEPDSLVAPECPEPSDTPCTLEEAPVICPGECEYANQCVATSADLTFTNETCCPVSTGICTLEYAPVNCFGCEYGNQCQATNANPELFTPENCTPVENP